MKHNGLRDTPLKYSEEDCLGLTRYARALTVFAEKCETPMTIALQGDWGSGKTSLMNLIRGQLEEKPERYQCIWFNTWQYSQFGLEDQLAASLISFFISKIPGNSEKKARLREVTAKLGRLARVIGKEVGGMAGGAMKAAAVLAGEQAIEKTELDPAASIAALKEELATLVKELSGENDEKRIVVFIDDLDRLSPVKAVELLEAFKLFLDIQGCVFFLACDYKVVNQGLKAKFGAEFVQNSEKSFFDKIIQLPFKMPVAQYEVKRYIKSLLEDIGVTCEDSDIKKYQQLIVTSIGFNPRGLKRAFNALLLLKQVEGIAEESSADKNSSLNVDQSERDRLLFAIICIQLSYENFYNFLCRSEEEDIISLFSSLRSNNTTHSENKIGDLIKKINTEYDPDRFQQFIDALYKAMQLKIENNDNAISTDEVKLFYNMLTLSRVTSTIEDQHNVWIEDQNYDIRRVNNIVCSRIKVFLDQECCFLRGKKGQVIQFEHKRHKGKSDMEVILWQPNEKLNWVGVSLERTGITEKPYRFSIDAGLYDQNKDEVLDSLKNYFKNAMSTYNTDQLNIIDEGYPWFRYINIYCEDHNITDADVLYNKIEQISGTYLGIIQDYFQQ